MREKVGDGLAELGQARPPLERGGERRTGVGGHQVRRRPRHPPNVAAGSGPTSRYTAAWKGRSARAGPQASREGCHSHRQC
ncbi:hypothetical protein OG799_07680 [Micromonospora sp. NBC_00898]|uniref:hypothetical protein n=1 Tax=Micromonospora sp. NBC_00898 TaxID=2975981 RepID=UPI00386E8388|nr:hypothetical protein OG799_07680 [Micromonospora sp. NBC_00898]